MCCFIDVRFATLKKGLIMVEELARDFERNPNHLHLFALRRPLFLFTVLQSWFIESFDRVNTLQIF